MQPMATPSVTERQQKWAASVRASLERDTGKSLAEWVAIARTCPESKPRARQKWLKDNHSLLQNRAMMVLNEAFNGGADRLGDPDAVIDALWTDPASRAIYEAVDALALNPGGVIRGPRKTYTAWSRGFQFAAARPVKGGKLMLGLAVPTDASPRLEPPKNESWSERLKARMLLSSVADADADIAILLRRAWESAG